MKGTFFATLFLLIGVSTSFTPCVSLSGKHSAQLFATAEKEKEETFRKADFVSSISEKTGMNKKDSEDALKVVFEVLQEQVSAGKRVTLPGFGTFTLRQRAARKGRNPRTGEELMIAASKAPGFTASKTWKDEINGKKG